MMLALMPLSFTSCSSDDDESAADTDSKGKESQSPLIESQSPLIGTWVNETSPDIFYALVFIGDGTGFYVEETNNSLSFSYRTFKFTTIANDTNSGSVEIAFDDGGKLENKYLGGYENIGKGGTGVFTVTQDHRLQLTGIDGIEKTIFTVPNKDYFAKPNIEGFWTNEDHLRESSDQIVMFQVNSDNSGIITVLNENTHPMVYSNSFYEFGSFDVFNDILKLKLTNGGTINVRVNSTTNNGTQCLQESIAGTTLYKSNKPTDIQMSLLEGQWIGHINDSYGNFFVYMRIMKDQKMFACSYQYEYGDIRSNKTVAGKYSLKNRMLSVTEKVVYGDDDTRTKEMSFYIRKLESAKLFAYTSYIEMLYSKMKGVTLEKMKPDALENQLTGTWEVTGYWGYADYRPKSYTFGSDGSYSMIDYDNELKKGQFMIHESKLYLFGDISKCCDISIEDGLLYIDYTYRKK